MSWQMMRFYNNLLSDSISGYEPCFEIPGKIQLTKLITVKNDKKMFINIHPAHSSHDCAG